MNDDIFCVYKFAQKKKTGDGPVREYNNILYIGIGIYNIL